MRTFIYVQHGFTILFVLFSSILFGQNVGIGTTSPSEKLEVAGKTKTLDFQMTQGATDGFILQSDATGNATWVSPDSVSDDDWTISDTNIYRMPGFVGIGVDSPRAQLQLYGNGGILAKGRFIWEPPYFSPLPEYVPEVGTGSTFMWSPNLAALRVGYVDSTEWERDSIGWYSIAMGRNVRATGNGAIALGYGTRTDGWYSLATGAYARASGNQSFAAGYYTRALGNYSVAFGQGALASGIGSFAGGFYPETSGNYSFCYGVNSMKVTGGVSFAFGEYSQVHGDHSASFGVYNKTYADNAQTLGIGNKVSGDYATGIGRYLRANSQNTFVIGRFNEILGDSTAWVSSDPVFEIGIGSHDTARATAMVVLKNGNTGIGITAPLFNLQVGDGTMAASNASNTRVVVSDNTNDNRAAFLTLAKDASGNKIEGQFESDGHFFDAIIFGSITSHPIYVRTGNQNRMYFSTTGEVGIGTTAPSEMLQIAGNVYASGGDFYGAAGNGVLNMGGGIMSATINTIADGTPTYNNINGDEDLLIADDLEVQSEAYKPGGGSWVALSDRRLKRNIQPYQDGLDQVRKINPVWYQYNEKVGLYEADRDKKYIGVIAQDMQAIAPYMVSEENLGQTVQEDEEGEEVIVDPGTPYLTYDATALTYMLVNAVKELDQKVSEIETLKTQLKDLQEEVEALKKVRQ